MVMVFDSGASVSVMSEGLFHRLNLKINGGTLSLASFYDKQSKRSFVCPHVMVADHLRPEHFVCNPRLFLVWVRSTLFWE